MRNTLLDQDIARTFQNRSAQHYISAANYLRLMKNVLVYEKFYADLAIRHQRISAYYARLARIVMEMESPA